MAHIHGINMGTTMPGIISQVSVPQDSACADDNDNIKAIDGKKATKVLPKRKVHFPSTSTSSSTVQCWLCDGPHSFHQCQELTKMKSVCIKRPSVLKHFQQLLLDKNGEAIRVLLDAPEFFDDTISQAEDITDNHFDQDISQDNPSSQGQINSLHIGVNDVNEDKFVSSFDVISCLHDMACNDQSSIESIHSIFDLFTSDTINRIESTNAPHVQVDGGADRSITPHRELVHGLRPPDVSKGEKTHINDAGVHSHRIVGYGHFHVRCLDAGSNIVIIEVPCAYIPSIPSTLLNFRTIPNLLNVDEISNMILEVGAANLIMINCNDETFQLVVPLVVYKTRLYAIM
jgi:hypothetical protein